MDDLIIYKNDYGKLEKEQLSLDMGESWEDTGNIRLKELIESNSCLCGIHYQWVERGTICDYTDKRQLLVLQQSLEDSCEGWIDVVPRIAKMGDVIETNSPECGTVEWEIRYEESCNGFNLMQIGYYWIKEPDSSEWVKLDCPPILGEVIEYNSCGCGYSEFGEWYDSDEYICGSEIGYPSTVKYRKQYRDEICKDTIIKEKADFRWIEFELDSCDCGYFYWGEWYDEGEFICGSELGSGYQSTSKYLKQYRDKYCGDNIIESKAESRYIVSEYASCDCGYANYQWLKIRYECQEKTEDTLVISRSEGNWSVTDKTFTSNDINDNETTVQRIYFSGVTTLYLSYNQSSESSYDYLIVGNIDKSVTNSTSTTDNFGNAKGKTNGEFTIPVADTNEHFIELMYRKDSSTSNGTDSVTVTLSSIVGDINTPLLYEEYTDTACSQGVSDTRRTKADTRRVDGNFTCEFDPNTQHNTTKKTEIILQYYDKIDSEWKPTPCVENGVIDYRYEELSQDCGYNIRWREEGETCCGSLEGAINEPQYSCETYPYSSYAIEIEEVTYNYNDAEPIYEPTGRVRYGRRLELQSESCGYIPILTQWKLLCPDVTADNYKTPEDLDECVECHNQQGAPSLFAIEYEQTSTDGGLTWKDTGRTRTEKLLKWKSKACGYTGDIFETRTIEGTTYCDGTTLKGSTEIWVSSDNGDTWSLVANSRTDDVVLEENSTQCQE